MSIQYQEKYDRNWSKIGAIATIVAIPVGIIIALLTASGNAGPSSPVVSSVSSPEPPVPTVQIEEPAQGESVGYNAGTEVTGTASHAGGRSLVLFNVESGPEGGRVYYTASDPLLVINDRWGAHVAPIGAPGGEREVVTFVAVLADENCENLITELHARPEDEQYFQDELPSGCEGPLDSVRVVKDHG